MKKALSLLLIFCLTFAGTLPCAAIGPTRPEVFAGAFVLMEKDDRYILAANGENARMAPASTTKIMTALIALERCAPDETVVVSRAAANTEGSSAYLRQGEKIRAGDLLYCLMLASANDAATALAEHIAGNIEAFAALMNEKAAALGLKNTHFQNPHGLNAEGHYSSALDLALLAAAALDNDDFARIVSTKRTVIGEGTFSRTLVNHNRLLFSLEGCIGVKTGYTVNAGRCLVSACKKNGATVICVTLSCRDDWDTHALLYDYAFSRVKRVTVEERFFSLPLVGGEKETVEVRAQGYSVLTSADALVETQVVCPHLLFPDLENGETVGEVIVYLDGKETARLPVYACEQARAAEKRGFFLRLIDALKGLFNHSDEKG